MPLEKFINSFLPIIESELRDTLAILDGSGEKKFRRILSYHLGWEGEGRGKEAGGKRVRPLLVLLTCEAAGGIWEHALPAAAAVELVHNFSLIHDDIQDNSPLRRGRATVWKIWGIPQGINAGDAMFALAHLGLLGLKEMTTPEITLEAIQILQSSCLKLTFGQFLDIDYENRKSLDIEDYWPMVSGKTASLLSACTEIGALIANVSSTRRLAYNEFGYNLGLAFQAHDDLLGIWGDAKNTGKSNYSDLTTGKKSLPVLYGLAQQGPFSERWQDGPISQEDVPEMAALLEAEGALIYTRNKAEELTKRALTSWEEANPQGEAGMALRMLANNLLRRKL